METGLEQSKADPCLLRNVVNVEVTFTACIHVDNLVVAAKDKEVFHVFYVQLLEDLPVNDMVHILVS